MALFDFLRRKAPAQNSPDRSSLLGWLSSKSGGAISSSSQSKLDYLRQYQGWVYACVTAIATDVASINLHLFRQTGNGDPVELFDHPALQALNRANASMTRYELFEVTQSHLELAGNAFWYLARATENGPVEELYPIRPDRMRLVPGTDNPLDWSYEYVGKGGKIPLQKSDILHFKTFNAEGDYPLPSLGIGTVQAAISAIATNVASHDWNEVFFKNSARPDVALVTPAEMDEGEADRVLSKWNAGYQGVRNAFKTALLRGGLDVKNLGFSQREMDFVEQLRFSRDEILGLFRVPKSVLGITEDVNRANAEASNYVFALRNVKPKMQRIADTLNEFYLPLFATGNEVLYFTYDNPVPADQVAEAQVFALGIDKWLTRNDIRGELGLTPTTQGDSIFGPFGLQPIDQTVPQTAKAVRRQWAKRRPSSDEVITKTVRELIDEMAHPVIAPEPEPVPEATVLAPKRISGQALLARTEQWQKRMDVETDQFYKQVSEYLKQQEAEVQANLRDELKGLDQKEYTLKASSVANILFDKSGAVKAGISLITPQIRRWVKENGDDAMTVVGLPAAFDATVPAVRAWQEERAKYFADTINETTADALTETLKEGLGAGESIPELAKRIEDVYAGRDPVRIARTEASAAANFGTERGFEQAGVKQVEWLVVNPEDEDCISNAGVVMPIGKAFPSGDVRPPVHPNCVCTLLPVIE